MENNNNNTLSHHGIKGQQWGRRRYQNPDGTLTALGRKRYAKELEQYKKEKQILKNKAETQKKLSKLEAAKKEVEELRTASKTKSDSDENSSNTSQTSQQPKKQEPQISKRKLKKLSKPVSKRKLRKMSETELQARIDRIDFEKKYSDLSVELKNSRKKLKETTGKKIFKESVENASKNLLTQVFSHMGSVVLNEAFSKSEKFAKRDDKGNPLDVIFSNNKKK